MNIFLKVLKLKSVLSVYAPMVLTFLAKKENKFVPYFFVKP
jgi:hypothetical protein